MRILMAVHHFPPRYIGGAEWRTHRTAKALQARGHEVRVVCIERVDEGPRDGVAWRDDVFEGVAVRRLSFNLASAPDPALWEYDNAWIGTHLRALIADYRPEIFHLVSGYLMSGRALQTAQACGLPTVVSLTDFWFLCRRLTLFRSDGRLSSLPVNPAVCARCLGEERRRFRLPGRIMPGLMSAYWRRQGQAIARQEARQAFLLATLNQASTILSPSQFLRSVFVQAGISPARLRFMRQGRDFPEVTPLPQVKVPAARLRVGYLGQIAEHKGVHLLPQALATIPSAPVSVRIYGDLKAFPRYAERLRQLCAKDQRLQLMGPYQNQTDLPAIMSDLDVVVVPSMWYENSPNVILEAFAYHVPVIVSDLGGMAELVEEGVSGLRFLPGEAADLARCLQRLITEPDLLARLGTGQPAIKSVAQEIDEIEAVYHEISTAGAQAQKESLDAHRH